MNIKYSTYMRVKQWCARRGPWLTIMVVLGSLVPFSPAIANDAKQDFPRLAGIQIGKSPYPDGLRNPDYQREMARLDLVILGSTTRSVIGHATAIKDMNPEIMLGHYSNLATLTRNPGDYFGPLNSKLDSERGPNNTNAPNWWLHDVDGNIVTQKDKPNRWRTNLTEWVQPDANGDRFPEFMAKYDFNWVMNAPVWDFWFEDVVGYRPKFQNRGFIGDFSGGRTFDIDELSAAWRRGHRAHWDEIRRLTPDKMIIANLNWYLYQDQTGRWDLEEYDQQVEGGVLEHIMNWDRSIEADKGWETVRTFYKWTMSYLKQPKLVIFNVKGDPTDYRFFRYAFATCLMNDGYFDFSPNGEFNFGTVQWFDEFDLAGQSDTSWLGQAVSAPPEQPWRNGVYRRNFMNGMALVNPRGNGEVTIEVEAGFFRIDGNQDSRVNNGQPASSITLADGDGILLVRDPDSRPFPYAQPKPPVLEGA